MNSFRVMGRGHFPHPPGPDRVKPLRGNKSPANFLYVCLAVAHADVHMFCYSQPAQTRMKGLWAIDKCNNDSNVLCEKSTGVQT